MSTYIVAPETIDRIVTYLDELQLRHEWLYLETLNAADVAVDQPNTLDLLGNALYRLNAAAVDHRYGESDEAPAYRYTYRRASPTQVYKSLQCFLYQCSEGDVPQHPLYRALDRIRRRLADEIIARLPEYQAAVWG